MYLALCAQWVGTGLQAQIRVSVGDSHQTGFPSHGRRQNLSIPWSPVAKGNGLNLGVM